MLRDVQTVQPLPNYRLHVTFDDGAAGEVNVAALVDFTGVFAPLRDDAVFRQVRVHPELRVVCWPNGADLDTDVLYREVTGLPLPGNVPA
jgi:hypothetical protein